MLYQIVSLLLEVVVGLVGGACLLRLYMQYQRIPCRRARATRWAALSSR